MAQSFKIDWNKIKKQAAKVKIDPSLDKYADIDLFPEKTARANAIIAQVGLPQEYYDQQSQ